MEISQERLRELIIKALIELGVYNDFSAPQQTLKVYMVCGEEWDEKYSIFMKDMEAYPNVKVYPVIHSNGFEKNLKKFKSCYDIIPINQVQGDLENSITVFPVVTQDIISKTALLISDTFENIWVSSCINQGGKIVFMLDGIPKLSGKETIPFKQQILAYYKRILEFGVEIFDGYEFLSNDVNSKTYIEKKHTSKIEYKEEVQEIPKSGTKKRVITASNIEQYVCEGELVLNHNDIITDLAKDRAKFLNISIK